MSLLEQLKRHEGLELKPYRDTMGLLTIGYGRNLDGVGISKEEAEYLLMRDIRSVTQQVLILWPWAHNLNVARQNVLINMAFNMGVQKLAGFVNTLKAIEEGRWDDAASGMLASKWATQVKSRATELAEQMRSGVEK